MHLKDKIAIEKLKQFYMDYLLVWISVSTGIGVDTLVSGYTPGDRFTAATLDGDACGIGIALLVFAWLSYRTWETKRKL